MRKCRRTAGTSFTDFTIKEAEENEKRISSIRKIIKIEVEIMNMNEPLAFRVRPKTLEEYIGQEHVLRKR